MDHATSRGIGKKTAVFLLILFCVALTALCVFGAWFFYSEEFYTTPKDMLLEDSDYNMMLNKAFNIANQAYFPDSYSSRYNPEIRYSGKNTNLRYVLVSEDGEILSSNEEGWGLTENPASAFDETTLDPSGSGTTASDLAPTKDETAVAGGSTEPYSAYMTPITVYLYRHGSNSFIDVSPNAADGNRVGSCTVWCRVLPGTPVGDEFRLVHLLYDFLYAVRYAVFPAGFLAAAAAIALYVLLLTLSGRRPGSDMLFPGPLYPVPFDLLAGFCVLLFVGAAVFIGNFVRAGTIIDILLAVFFLACLLVTFLALSMSAAVRIKAGTLFSGLFVWKCIVTLWEIAKWIGRTIKKAAAAVGRGISMIPQIWKVILLFGGLLFFEIVVFGASYSDIEVYWIFHLIEVFILFGLVVWRTVSLRKLAKGGDALASGNLSYHVNPEGMPRDLKKQAEALNRIGVGMNRAVEERMKSERMKTELITNVSHDIKTPLTSIINYTDLLAKEEPENERVREYTDVLTRQSVRLKRLIDDLVEASKASTGNLDVSLAPCDASVFLEQAAGEYEQRLTDAGMTLCMAHPDHPVTILADGRRLWRVFDNLMNNIVKYGQPGTRVYLTLEEINRFAVVSFRNVSRDPLNVSPDELMERFVRGDASRSSATEGNGLGLSIAKSLTELQGGALTLSIDGDLFKAVLHFPVAEANPMPQPAPALTLTDIRLPARNA
ncbi:MAG: HAMP domain-containing histidine kinase [Clostridia bacterium]|nr:HAMP domain-containing histidine kinase [Clostridia bacterium]